MYYHGFLGCDERLPLVWEVQTVIKNCCVGKSERIYWLLLLVMIDLSLISVAENGSIECDGARGGNEEDALAV